MRMPLDRALCGVLWSLLLLTMSGMPALGQTASQLRPEETIPQEQRDAPSLQPVPKTSPETLPSEWVTLAISPDQLTVDNLPPGMGPQTEQLLQQLRGKRLTGKDVIATQAALQNLYSRAGFILARVILPPGGATDAELRYQVVDGFIEQLDLEGVSPRLQPRLRALLTPLVGQSWLRASTLYRQLSLANDMPGGEIAAALSKGQTFGAAVLRVAGKAKPLASWMSVSQSPSAELGPVETVAGVQISNLFGQGEQLVVQASGDVSGQFLSADPRYRALVSRLRWPIGVRGLAADLSYVSVSTEPNARPYTLPSASGFRKASLALKAPLRISEAGRIAAFTSIEAMTDRLDVAGHALSLSLDRLRVARFGIDLTGTRQSWPQKWQVQLTQSIGINALGARSAAKASALLPLSRQGADADFWKLELQADARQPLSSHVQVRLHIRAQSAFGGALLRAEQIGLAQNDGLSTLSPGALQGDDGALGRVEMSRQWLKRKVASEFYVFGAGGIVRNARPTALERSHLHGEALGGGIRSQIFSQGALRLFVSGEYGVGWRSDRTAMARRANFSVQMSY